MNKPRKLDFSDCRESKAEAIQMYKAILGGLNKHLQEHIIDDDRLLIEFARKDITTSFNHMMKSIKNQMTRGEGVKQLEAEMRRSHDYVHLSRIMTGCMFAGIFLDPSDLQKRKIGAQFKASAGASGGRRSGEVRRARRKWVPPAESIALRHVAQYPDASQDDIASEITGAWKLGNVKAPSHETLKKHVAAMIKEGRLAKPKRVTKRLRSAK